MPRPRLSEGTRQRLLEASVAAFLEQGYHGTGIKDLLDRVEIPKGSFYNYFPSKEALGIEAIAYYSRCSVDSLASALDGAADPVSGLRAHFEEISRGFEESQFAGGCLLANLAGELDGDPFRTALSRGFREWRDGVQDALGDAQVLGLVREDLPAEELADMVIEAWEGAVIRMKIDRTVAPLHRCLDRFLDGYFRP